MKAEDMKYREQVKVKELGITSTKGISTEQRGVSVLHILQPFKKHVLAPETF